MIKVNFADGTTKKFNLECDAEALALRAALGDQGPPHHVTALCIFHKPYVHTLPKPVGVGFVSRAGAELLFDEKKKRYIGECVWFDVGGCRVRKIAYNGKRSKLTRTEILPRRRG